MPSQYSYHNNRSASDGMWGNRYGSDMPILPNANSVIEDMSTIGTYLRLIRPTTTMIADDSIIQHRYHKMSTVRGEDGHQQR